MGPALLPTVFPPPGSSISMFLCAGTLLSVGPATNPDTVVVAKITRLRCTQLQAATEDPLTAPPIPYEQEHQQVNQSIVETHEFKAQFEMIIVALIPL